MFFRKFPKLYYEFDFSTDPTVKDIAVVRIQDISIGIRKKVDALREFPGFEQYDMKDGETFEDVSYRLYGTMDYHWIIQLLNDRFHYIDDCVMNSPDLHAYINRKYGDQLQATHHWEDVYGNIVSVYTENEYNTIINSGRQHSLPATYSAYLAPYQKVTNYEYEMRQNELKRRIYVIHPNQVEEIAQQLSNLVE